MVKKGDFLKFRWPIIWPETDKVGRFCGQKVQNKIYFSPNFFYADRTKIHDFKSKKQTPPKKKSAIFFFFWGGVGILQSFNLDMSWADIAKSGNFFNFKDLQKKYLLVARTCWTHQKMQNELYFRSHINKIPSNCKNIF